jgi:outer membrane lipoprotein-sorting protein
MSGCNYAARRLRAHLDNELASAERVRVAAHLETCAACRRRVASLAETARLASAVPLEEPPPHFTTNLQVRLASLRPVPQPAPPANWWGRLARGWRAAQLGARPKVALGAAVVLGGVVAAMLIAPPRASVAEIARGAERSWRNTRNYACELVTTGTYQGRDRSFRQRIWFARPGYYRLETEQDYPLVSVFEPRAVRHLIPGGDWEGRGPLLIVRPRTGGTETLPFPYGITWPTGPNVTIETLVGQLRATRDAALLGSEPVEGEDCYQVRFRAAPPGGRQPETCTLWLAKNRLLPLRIDRYRDAANHTITEAVNLVVNMPMVPSNLFNPEVSPPAAPLAPLRPMPPGVPAGPFVIHGDVDPHVLALKPARTADFDRDPLAATRREVAQRAPDMPFAALAPEQLPRDYRLVRVRRSRGRWLDVHWIDDQRSPARVIRLTEQPAGGADPPETAAGRPVPLELPAGPVTALVLEGRHPYPFCYVSWRQDGTLVTLATADLSTEETLKIARSTRPVPAVVAAPHPFVGPPAPPARRPAPTVEPETPAPSLNMEITPAPSAEPPMLPDTAEEEDVRPDPAAR